MPAITHPYFITSKGVLTQGQWYEVLYLENSAVMKRTTNSSKYSEVECLCICLTAEAWPKPGHLIISCRCEDWPMQGVSPTRPSILFSSPPVEVAHATLPSVSTATAPTVPIFPLNEETGQQRLTSNMNKSFLYII